MNFEVRKTDANESAESMIARFRRKAKDLGLFPELRRRQHFTKPSKRKRDAKHNAKHRIRRYNEQNQ